MAPTHTHAQSHVTLRPASTGPPCLVLVLVVLLGSLRLDVIGIGPRSGKRIGIHEKLVRAGMTSRTTIVIHDGNDTAAGVGTEKIDIGPSEPGAEVGVENGTARKSESGQ